MLCAMGIATTQTTSLSTQGQSSRRILLTIGDSSSIDLKAFPWEESKSRFGSPPSLLAAAACKLVPHDHLPKSNHQ